MQDSNRKRRGLRLSKNSVDLRRDGGTVSGLSWFPGLHYIGHYWELSAAATTIDRNPPHTVGRRKEKENKII